VRFDVHSRRFCRVLGRGGSGQSSSRPPSVFRKDGVGENLNGSLGARNPLFGGVLTIRILDEEDILPVSPKVPAPAKEVDELTRLREDLAKAEAQVAQLKLEKAIGKGPTETHEFHAKPLSPNMMPDAKAKIAREEKMYYRLGLYKIDRLCSNETANLLKVNPPLST
jgi:hypothetical protein